MPVKIRSKSRVREEIEKSMGVQSSVTLVRRLDMPAEDKQVLQSQALETDDEFEELYALADATQDKPQILRPPYNPASLLKIVHQNNALGQCISAYEVNVDGTGYDIRPKDETKESDTESEEANRIKEFFTEIYPKTSFVALRRKLRRDVEATGNGYLEALRNLEGRLIFLKHVHSKNMRLIKLDEPVPVEYKVSRFGQEETIEMMVRQRRFVQMVGKRLVYFKEYGVERHLSKSTGKWETEDNPVEEGDRATEIIWFTAEQDALTPYGVPRWERQIPSALGSRKAEELNLDYFNAGGLPPALFILMGGSLALETKKELQTYLTGKGANKHRAAIVEAMATGGTIDKEGGVKVQVERFGSERATDSMFEGYDDKCEKRVRTSFRLPPLFVGRTDDYSYASAFASYTVAEAQVFRPEREEFDEVINVTVMREIAPEYVFKSMPLAVNDVNQKLEALGLVKDFVERENLVGVVAEITDLTLTVKEEQEMPPGPPQSLQEGQSGNVLPFPQGGQQGGSQSPTGGQASQAAPGSQDNLSAPSRKMVQKMDPTDILNLASEWANLAAGLDSTFTKEQIHEVTKSMDKRERTLFEGYVTLKLMNHTEQDLEGSIKLAAAAAEALAGCQEHDH